MFTQCPECKTVFEVSPADLAVAAGLVRCGECSQTFSALKSLAETPLEFEIRDADPAGETAAEESSEPEVPTVVEDDTDGADEADEADAGAVAKVIAAAAALAAEPDEEQDSDRVDEPDDVDTSADDESDGDDDAEEASIDEAATVAEAEDEDVDPAQAELDDLTDETAGNGDGGDEIVLDEFYEPPGSDDDEPVDDEEDWDLDEDVAWGQEEDEATESEPADESALFSLPVPELLAAGIVAAATVPEKLEGGEAAIDPFAQDAREPDHVDDAGADQSAITPWSQPAMRRNDAVDARDARDLSDYLRAPQPGRLAAAGWTGGSALLTLLLFLQFVHHNRGDLVLHQRVGPAVKTLYSAVGLEVRPNWRVDDYKIVGEARLIELPAAETGQPPGEFRFVAIIANRADRPQPPPLVRITLRDRWGDPQGVRNFAPPEYLSDRSMVEQLLEPGQRLRVVLNLLGPGAEVDGFDFDMCLPDTEGQLRCSSEPAG